MHQQKGFSLTEVLASLLLVSTLAFTLLQQQWQSKHLLNQLILRMQGTQLLNQIQETCNSSGSSGSFGLRSAWRVSKAWRFAKLRDGVNASSARTVREGQSCYETFVAQVKKLPPIKFPYHVELNEKNQEMRITLTWYEHLGSMTRILGQSK